MIRKKSILFLLFCPIVLFAQTTLWPTVTPEMHTGTRWWWLGSAVDKPNLTYNLEEYARAGMGTVEITPIYGVQKNEANDIQFLSPKWMEMLAHTEAETKRLGMQTDMNTGTGWPFGGPEVTLEDAASKLLTREYTANNAEVFSTNLVHEDKTQQRRQLRKELHAVGT